LDQEPLAGSSGLLQSPGSGDLMFARTGHRHSRLALATGRPTAKRDPATTRYSRARLLHLDLAGLLAAASKPSKPGAQFVVVPLIDRGRGSRSNRRD